MKTVKRSTEEDLLLIARKWPQTARAFRKSIRDVAELAVALGVRVEAVDHARDAQDHRRVRRVK